MVCKHYLQLGKIRLTAMVLVATGVLGLFLIQSSYHAGPVTASQASLTIIDPMVSVVIGIYLFHDRLDTAGWRLPVEVVAIVVVVAGVVLQL